MAKVKRKDITVYQLTHTYGSEDEEVYIKTDIKELDLVKLIKIWQMKAFYLEETCDIETEDMRDILIHYDGIRVYPNQEDVKELEALGEDSFDFIEIDLYEVWEASDIKVEEYDLNSKEQYNPKALKVFLRSMIDNLECEDKSNF